MFALQRTAHFNSNWLINEFTFTYPQIELVDIHFGTGISHTTVDLDPYVVYDHLNEIRACQRTSRSVFFIVSTFEWSTVVRLDSNDLPIPLLQSLIGHSSGEFCLPIEIRKDIYSEIVKLSSKDDIELLKSCYKLDTEADIYYLHTNFR